MVTNMKLAFTNVPFRHNSACIIQKLLRIKRIIIVRLAYISLIFPNGSRIIYIIIVSKSCILVSSLKQKSYVTIERQLFF